MHWPSMARLRNAATRWARRTGRRSWQRVCLNQSVPKMVVFVVGSQRSGTNMVLQTLRRDPASWSYNEDDPAVFRDFRLRSRDVVRQAIRSSPARTILLKPLCDSQWLDRLLEDYENSRAVWVFRHYSDVANSAVKRWSEGERAPIRHICRGEFDKLGWIGERLSQETIRLVRDVYRDDVSLHESAVLVWCIRNRLFFDMRLNADERVRLVKYEDLVSAPSRALPPLFEFVGCRFRPAFATIARTSSIRKEVPPRLHPEIRRIADAMMHTLEEAYCDGPKGRRHGAGSTITAADA